MSLFSAIAAIVRTPVAPVAPVTVGSVYRELAGLAPSFYSTVQPFIGLDGFTAWFSHDPDSEESYRGPMFEVSVSIIIRPAAVDDCPMSAVVKMVVTGRSDMTHLAAVEELFDAASCFVREAERRLRRRGVVISDSASGTTVSASVSANGTN